MKYLIIAFIIVSCSSERIAVRKLQKAERLIKQAEALGAKQSIDTVFIVKVIPGDTIRVSVPIERFIRSLKDTVIFNDRVKIHFRTIRDTVTIHAECKNDTIRIPITIHKTIECPPTKSFFDNLRSVGGWIVGILLLILACIIAAKWWRK